MSKPDSPADESPADVTAVTAPAPGGSLAEFVEYVRSTGRPAALAPDGRSALVPGAPRELQRFPLECNEPACDDLLRQALRRKGIGMVTYLLPDSPHGPANCFDYVCRGPRYELGELDSHARRDTRRGLRQFRVRLCTWDELAAEGFAAHADTMDRHGYGAADDQWLKDMIARQRGTPFYEIWGAWDGEALAAWATFIKIDDWAIVDIARSRTDALKGCPNNAIIYTATRRMLVEEQRQYVTYGLSSIQVDANELSMHRYKVRMGYQPDPCRRVFHTTPLLRAALASKAVSWTWEKLARAMPESATLRKVAGMSRLVSGREKDPLSWAR